MSDTAKLTQAIFVWLAETQGLTLSAQGQIALANIIDANLPFVVGSDGKKYSPEEPNIPG